MSVSGTWVHEVERRLGFMDPARKMCRDCGMEKPLDEFHRATKSKDGHTIYCKPCAVARTMRWEKANPDRKKAQTARFRAAHRVERNAQNLAYYHVQMATDPERVRARRREWAKTEKGRLANRLARHARRGASSDREWVAILLRDPCSYCGEPGGEIDHITPLSLNGDGDWSNLTASCRRCNARKNDGSLLVHLGRF